MMGVFAYFSTNVVQILVQGMSYNTTKTFDIYIIISSMNLFCHMRCDINIYRISQREVRIWEISAAYLKLFMKYGG